MNKDMLPKEVAQRRYSAVFKDDTTDKQQELSGWICVDDRLPEECEEVMVVLNHEAERQIDIGASFTYTPSWDEIATVPFRYWDNPYFDGQDWAHDLVTHWMPLPELPSSPFTDQEGEVIRPFSKDES